MQIRILLLYIPSTDLTLVRNGQFYLYAVDSVNAINEENKDKDKSYLMSLSTTISEKKRTWTELLTFMPYCNFAMIGLSDMKVNNLRRHVKGNGMINAMKMTISVTRRRNT